MSPNTRQSLQGLVDSEISFSESTASMSSGSASEALGEECWNLMEILVGNLYDPDEQVPMCHAANKRSFRCSLLLYFLAISSFRCDVL